MAAKGSTFSNDYLKLIFHAIAIANIADNAASSPLTHLYVSLHTSAPTVGGSQSTNECAYTSYARVAVVRSASGWTIAGNQVTPAAIIQFPTATGGSETATHIAVGTAATGTGKILYTGALNGSMAISSGYRPELSTSTVITET
jgi:hypothetical protein